MSQREIRNYLKLFHLYNEVPNKQDNASETTTEEAPARFFFSAQNSRRYHECNNQEI
jgi:hypothetical protein